jgi:hypothetical protein
MKSATGRQDPRLRGLNLSVRKIDRLGRDVEIVVRPTPSGISSSARRRRHNDRRVKGTLPRSRTKKNRVRSTISGPAGTPDGIEVP